MKFRATVTYEWEEDLANWQHGDIKVTEDNLLEMVTKYIHVNPAYLFGKMEHRTITIQAID